MISDISKQAPARALEQVLRLFATERSHDAANNAIASWKGFTYHTSFTELWDTPVSQLPFKVAIIWGNDMATAGIGEVNLESYLSPLAWAVCKLKARNDLDVLILDTAPSRHRKESRLYRFIEAIQIGRMPRLRLVTLDSLGRFLEEQHAFSAPAPAGATELLEVFAEQMRDELTREGGESNRHAIQNILGPLMLLGRECLAKKGIAEHALLQVFETSGLLPKGIKQGDLAPKTMDENSWGEHPLRLLLVDDQAECGWADWVRSTMPRSKPGLVSLDVLTSPEPLLDALALSGERVDMRFELKLPGGAGTAEAAFPVERQTILLLDLRLHSTTDIESEVAFFRKLLPICERFKTDGKASQFAWSGFLSQELKDVQAWCEKPKRENDGHFVGLSLLPRLVALLDMSVPIIIFSSTGQRSIIGKLKPYGNIITDFEKPRFFGRDVRNTVAETHLKFEQAIKTARRLLKARKATSLTARPTQSPIGLGLINSPQVRDIDVFIDESGESWKGLFSIGAVVFLYQDDQAKQGFVRALSDENLVWGLDENNAPVLLRGIPPPAWGVCLPKTHRAGMEYEAALKQIEDLARVHGITIAACGLCGRGAESRHLHFPAKDFGLSPDFADTVYRVMLSEIIESCIFGPFWFLPAEATAAVSLQVATRLGSVPEEHEEMAKQFMGLKFPGYRNDGRAFFYSVGGNDILPLVVELIEMHPKAVARFKFARVRGAALYDFDELRRNFQDKSEKSQANYRKKLRGDFGPLAEQLHYLADWVSRFAKFSPDEIPPTARMWFERGFLQQRNDAFRSSLRATRAADGEDFALALAILDTSGDSPSCEGKASNDFVGWTALRAKDWRMKLDGTGFLRLANRLAEQDQEGELAKGDAPNA
jgi:hypothetical protein